MLEALADIGRSARTGGYHRDAWSPADLELREWFRQEAARRGLDLDEDRNGNLWAWWWPATPGTPATGTPVMPGVVTGSHLDSVRDGGAFDGPLGVVSAFLAVDLLRGRGFEPGRPLGIVCFTDEEGARFGVPCVGSRLLTGALDPDSARRLTDDEGDTLAEVLERAGRRPRDLGADPATLARVGVFVELHIEQGRALGRPVGVAEAIWPHGRWRFDFTGEANHAGTTALADRDDPMLAYARSVLAARAAAEEHGVLATFGKVRVEPGSANAIPSRVSAWLDARGADEERVHRLVAELAEGGPGSGNVTCESWTPEVVFDAALRDRIAAVADGAVSHSAPGPGRCGTRTAQTGTPAVPTGAGHDAGVLARAGVPSAMLFVRNPTGVSHSPREFAAPADCHAGVVALAAVLEDLCRT
ncbi:allantoate amidohydrolase [Microtetraspora sp. NBRC 16547]|uniref:allantoate amidohydrolase n=1 Tax=Microtetraspora sp. NBRC 16547 TaxID=3030993 RepID=UPI0024A32056|nr:allantoate amidohydrolase [Microtetraspora sp. NBRC 16547]GLX01326.1 Zn-dependent hydrolase [Microtetraspora sp. NBRC 16547]